MKRTDIIYSEPMLLLQDDILLMTTTLTWRCRGPASHRIGYRFAETSLRPRSEWIVRTVACGVLSAQSGIQVTGPPLEGGRVSSLGTSKTWTLVGIEALAPVPSRTTDRGGGLDPLRAELSMCLRRMYLAVSEAKLRQTVSAFWLRRKRVPKGTLRQKG